MTSSSSPGGEEKGFSGTVVAVLVLGLMLLGVTYRYWPDEERAIRRHLSNLAEALSVSSIDRSDVGDIARFAALREYFAPDISVSVEGRQLAASRDEAIKILRLWSAPTRTMRVELADVGIELQPGHEHARVRLTARVSTTDISSRAAFSEASSAAIAMAKLDDDWVITRVDAGAFSPGR